MSDTVRVVVIDDSAYVRKIVKQILSRHTSIEVVGSARNGQEALELVAELEPDVVTCDLNMPAMDGVAYVREQMARRPLPIIIITIASGSGEQVLAALDAGAVDFVQKPTALATDKLLDIGDELVEKVKAAALRPRHRLPRVVPEPSRQAAAVRPVVARAAGAPALDLIAIGTSTGGPQGLKEVIPRIGADFPVPIAIVLHMPVGYTAMYAERLNEISPLQVIEAKGGELVEPGRVFLAPAGQHLVFRRDASGDVYTQLELRPSDTPHRPSVDVLFHSAAEVFGARVLGVVMTGMGADGREGAAWIKAKGGMILTEAEDTCVVYGMPRSVDEAGLSDGSFPLDSIAQAIIERS